MQKLFLGLYAAAGLTVASCTEPTAIGGVIVDGTQLPVTITDTVAVELSYRAPITAEANRILTASSVVVGCLESPATGQLNARLGLELVELARPRVSLRDLTIDSAVLILPLVRTDQVGDTTAPTSLRVRSAAVGTIKRTEANYNTPLETTGTLYGTYEGPVSRRSGRANTFIGDTIRLDSVGPQLRIPLNDAFLDDITTALTRRTATDTLTNDSLFLSAFPGLIVEGGEACAKTIPAVNLTVTGSSPLGVTIYYRQGGATRQFRLINRRIGTTPNGNPALGGAATLRVEYVGDDAGSLLARLKRGGAVADSLAVIQSLGGAYVRVDFPDLSAFGTRRGVTFAELEVPVAADFTDGIPPLLSLVVKVDNNSGELEDYSALATQTVSPTPYSPFEGGVLTKVPDPRGGSDSVQVYRFTITSLFQDFISDRRDPTLYLVPRDERRVGGQTVILGPAAGQLRTRLRIASAVLP